MYSNRKSFFNYLIDNAEKNAQATLRLMFTHMEMEEQLQRKHELEQMKKEIADDVLSRISATVDITEIVNDIEELRRLIDGLGRN